MKKYIFIIFYLSMAVSTLSLSARDDNGERVRDFIREQMPFTWYERIADFKRRFRELEQ